jgi:hypothetical protein
VRAAAGIVHRRVLLSGLLHRIRWRFFWRFASQHKVGEGFEHTSIGCPGFEDNARVVFLD